jgi:hypothetical protein
MNHGSTAAIPVYRRATTRFFVRREVRRARTTATIPPPGNNYNGPCRLRYGAFIPAAPAILVMRAISLLMCPAKRKLIATDKTLTAYWQMLASRND